MMEKPKHIRFPDDLKKKIDKRAKECGLTFSAYVRMILTKEVDNG